MHMGHLAEWLRHLVALSKACEHGVHVQIWSRLVERMCGCAACTGSDFGLAGAHGLCKNPDATSPSVLPAAWRSRPAGLEASRLLYWTREASAVSRSMKQTPRSQRARPAWLPAPSPLPPMGLTSSMHFITLSSPVPTGEPLAQGPGAAESH